MPNHSLEKFTANERRAAFSLASIFSIRMLGLFIILPIFSLYAQHLIGTTPLLIGTAIGIYGLTQGLLQIPFGILSDHYPRKRIITVGLIIFASGSIVAALSHSIYGVIIGRALQGAGAVGSATLALVADLTREQQRTKAMAIVGISIGLTFYLGMILGPLLNPWLGVPGIFGLTAIAAGVGIVILQFWVPNPTLKTSLYQARVNFKALLHPELLRLNLGIFILHTLLTATFVVIPIVLHHDTGLSANQQLYIYLPLMLFACLLAIPCIMLAEKKSWAPTLFIGAIAAVLLSQLTFWSAPGSLANILLSLLIFFTAFTVLEAQLPARVSKVAPAAQRGTAMGIYSSAQFLGIFSGGVLAGWLYGQYSLSSVFAMGIIVASIWLLVVVIPLTQKQPIILSEGLQE